MVRYADDFVCCFQYEEDVKAFYQALLTRLRKFNLEIAEEKTKIICIRQERDKNDPPNTDSFDFLLALGIPPLPRGRSPWHVTQCYDTATREILCALHTEGVWLPKRYKARMPNGGRKSDHRIVPMKWGNAHGGKAYDALSILLRKHFTHAEVYHKCKRNWQE
nr:reverse transcriptase domain-containing protein [Ammoniphilus sp. YIM 78166]